MTGCQLFVMDPLAEVDPHHDTTYVIMREVEARGEEIWTTRSRNLQTDGTEFSVRATRVSIESAGGEVHYVSVEEKTLSLAEFDLVWMREDPPFDQNYLYSTYLLEAAPVPVINDPAGVRASNEKLFILQFPDLIPETWVGASCAGAKEFVDSVGGEAVVKSLAGYGGEDVFRLSSDNPDSFQVLEKLTREDSRPVMVQEFLPAVRETGDRRIFLVNGEPLGGLTRYPEGDDFRANLHSGGRAGEVYLSDREAEICEQIKPELQARGLYLVGLDLVDDKIMEINVTSPTCVQEINRGANKQLERQIVDFGETLIVAE